MKMESGRNGDRQYGPELPTRRETQEAMIARKWSEIFNPEEREVSKYNGGSEPVDTTYGRCVVEVTWPRWERVGAVTAFIRDHEGRTSVARHQLDDQVNFEDVPHECINACFFTFVDPQSEEMFTAYDRFNRPYQLTDRDVEEVAQSASQVTWGEKKYDPVDPKSVKARRLLGVLFKSEPKRDIPLVWHPTFTEATQKILE